MVFPVRYCLIRLKGEIVEQYRTIFQNVDALQFVSVCKIGHIGIERNDIEILKHLALDFSDLLCTLGGVNEMCIRDRSHTAEEK